MQSQTTLKTLAARWWQPLYLGAMTAVLYALLSGWKYDDPFITMRYALNLGSGEGMVYNPGQRILSTTSPLFALLLAVPASLGLDVPRSAILIGCLALAAGGLLLWDICRRWEAPLAGFAALLLYPTFTLVTWTVSSELPLYLAFSLAGLRAYLRDKFAAAGLLTGLGALARADGLVLAGLLVLDRSFRELSGARAWRSWLGSFAARFGTALVAVLLPWLAFGTLYFGSPVPVTLAAKRAQGLLPGAESYLAGLAHLPSALGQFPVYWIAGLLFILGLYRALVGPRRWLPILAWPVLVVLAYVVTGVPRAFWYYASLAPGLVAGVCLGLDELARKLPGRYLAYGSYAIFLVAALWAQFSGLVWQRQNPDLRAGLYRDLGAWFVENSSEDARIGLLEVGMVGFYAYPREMIDFAGLLHPEVAAKLSPDFGYADSAIWVSRNYQPNYLVVTQGQYRDLLGGYATDHCALIKIFTGETYAFGSDTLVYVCE